MEDGVRDLGAAVRRVAMQVEMDDAVRDLEAAVGRIVVQKRLGDAAATRRMARQLNDVARDFEENKKLERQLKQKEEQHKMNCGEGMRNPKIAARLQREVEDAVRETFGRQLENK